MTTTLVRSAPSRRCLRSTRGRVVRAASDSPSVTPIASVLVDKKMTYHHGACRYPATALLAQIATEADVDVVATARRASNSAKCRATTNKGKPCNNTPQKGEQFCGPHLTQLGSRPAPGPPRTTQPDPYDEPF